MNLRNDAKNVLKGVSVVAVVLVAYFLSKFVDLRYPYNVVVVGVVAFTYTFFTYAYNMVKVKLVGGKAEPDLDFIFALTHAHAVSTSGTSNVNVVDSVAKKDLYPKLAKYFSKVVTLTKNFGYDMPKSLYLVSSEASKLKYLKDFMERYAAAVKVGENIERFLDVEAKNFMNIYEYTYQRIMDSVNVLLSAYTAVMTSSIFVISNLLVLSLLFGGEVEVILISLIGVTAAMGAILIPIWLATPKDILVVSGDLRSEALKTASVTLLGASVLTTLLTFTGLLGALNLSFYYVATALGIALIIPGYLFRRVENYVKDLDKDFAVFIRMYANNLSIIPSPLKALEPLLSVLFGKIAKALKRLHTLLSSNLSLTVSLKNFVLYTRSELARRASRILEDTLKYGGDTAKVGLNLSELSLMIGRLRLRRYQVHKTFETSLYAIHLTNVLLISFITSLMTIFASVLTQIQTLVPFYPLPETFVRVINSSIIASMTFMNAVALTITNGGLKHTFTYYLAILLLLSGVGGILSDLLVTNLLGPVAEIISQPFKTIS